MARRFWRIWVRAGITAQGSPLGDHRSGHPAALELSIRVEKFWLLGGRMARETNLSQPIVHAGAIAG
jgi:hypothetical protein